MMDFNLKDMKFHWKVIIQAKGFLKIIEFVLALVTLSILAGYQPGVETSRCFINSSSPANVTLSLSTHYPFATQVLTRTNLTTGATAVKATEGSRIMISAGRQASFFVAWGSLTLFYCVIAVAVYIVAMPQAEALGKVYHLLAYSDLGFSIFWIFMWFVGSAEWAAGQNKLGAELIAIAISPDNGCSNPVTVITPYALVVIQSAIAIVFGFLNVFVWTCNLWWVIKDLPVYIAWKEKRSGNLDSQ